MSYYVEHMEQLKMAPMRAKHPGWIWNRSDSHMFLAPPEHHDAFTTVVEPGNSFSPGPGTYGVSAWLKVDGTLYAPEQTPQSAMDWRFEDGRYPISNCGWEAGRFRVETSLFTVQMPDTIDIRDYFRVTLTNRGDAAAAGTFCLSVRSFGAAGGPLYALAHENGVIRINNAPLLYAETPGRFIALSYEQSGSDISEAILTGNTDLSNRVDDPSGWASGALVYDVALAPGESVVYDFACHLHAGSRLFTWLTPLTHPLEFEQRKAALKQWWDGLVTPGLDVPNKRFHDAFYAQIAHLYMGSGLNAPHISPITYPTWWARDSAYIQVALAKAGFHDFARRSAEHAGRFQISCCFGPEADVPGERIWMISEHYLLTRDEDFLRRSYQYVQENARLIVEMRHTDRPLASFSELFNHAHCISPDITFTCAPAKDGLVMGRMDFSYPVFYVNSFCYLGLKRAAMCAEAVGNEADAMLFAKERDELRAAMKKQAAVSFGQNERDTCTAYAPSGWADPTDDFLRAAYEAYWHKKWCPNGVQTHEPLWTYFEIGDARNRVLIGERERAWKILEHYLDTHTCAGMYTYPEGEKDENSATLAWEKVRGWDLSRFVTPHGWSGAEMLALLRDCLVREDEDGRIFIGSGVPKEWRGHDFSVSDFPTYYGVLSYRYTAADGCVRVVLRQTRPAEICLELPFDAALYVESATE